MHDVLIIGGGPAGLSSAVFAHRRSLDVIVAYDNADQANVSEATVVDDWLGSPGISGTALMKKFLNHAKSMDIPIINNKITGIKKTPDGFHVTGENGLIEARTVIIATGTKHRKIEARGGKKYAHKGISYCANCEGPLYKGKNVLVVGGGDTAATYALLLEKIGANVSIIHRGDELRAMGEYKKQLVNSKVRIILNTVLKQVKGNRFVKSAVVLNRDSKKKTELPVEGIFIAIGSYPAVAGMIKGLRMKTNLSGYILVDKHGETNVPGIFAAGDCANNPTKRIITACSDGSKAAEAAYMYIQRRELGDKVYPTRGK